MTNLHNEKIWCASAEMNTGFDALKHCLAVAKQCLSAS